ncbi:MAG TPA: LCCL domain-containing protein [Gemmataceae bacterium]|nr:LCCL domain-containing protein [Gemmataceae bacterium]
MTRPALPIIPLVTATALLALVQAVRADEEPKKSTRPADNVLEVRLVDDSTMKLTLLEDRLEFLTTYGRLSIPVADVRLIELGLRIPDDVLRQIQQAVADLGSSQFRKREEAMTVLLKHRERSYGALKQAAKSPDAEVSKRAEELLEKLENTVPESRLDLPDHDVIHTDQSKIAGKIMTPSLRARSFAFGDVQVQLADCLAMSAAGFKEEKASAALPDPGTLHSYQGQQHIGKTYVFRVTGAASGSLWGTGMYTLDSSLAAAAVHMGVLKVGQTGNVKVTILGPSMGFAGSTRNGLTSSNYANYPGAYRIHARER